MALATCEECGGRLEDGEWYLVGFRPKAAYRTVGVKSVCRNCADKLLSEKGDDVRCLKAKVVVPW